MSDNKNIQDGRDRSKVAGNEEYEIEYLANKLNVTTKTIRESIQEVGNSREKIEEHVRKRRAEKG